ncbi:hypothetical protein ACEWY4_027026 [Coilia grayii]|uniref:Ig-like domain-containing protein n=1 Tax=Coilia grayii TaxID=363190 RepID=A0ABD1IRC3_9TELE
MKSPKRQKMGLQLILACTWIVQLSFQADSPTFYPGKLFATRTTAKEGQSLTLKCSFHGVGSSKGKHIYFCKDGIGVGMDILHGSDAEFTLRRLTQQDSGNYSCVYSEIKTTPSNVSAVGDNSIYIQILPQTASTTLKYKYELILLSVAILLAFLSSLGMCCICCKKTCQKGPQERQQREENVALYCEIENVPINTEMNVGFSDNSALYSRPYIRGPKERPQHREPLCAVYSLIGNVSGQPVVQHELHGDTYATATKSHAGTKRT